LLKALLETKTTDLDKAYLKTSEFLYGSFDMAPANGEIHS
jgi:hypothetical protein